MPFLQISDQIFSIAKTEFSAYIALSENGWGIRWFMDIAALPKEVKDGEEWEPKLSSHEFDLDLTPVFTTPIEADLLPGERYGEAPLLLYVFEHESVEQVRLKISWLLDGTFDIQLTGISAVFFDEQYADNLPIRVECNLSLEHIHVDEPNFDKAEMRLSQFLDRSLFGQAERHTRGGTIFKLN
jgi:hypothetical protein